MTNRWIEDTNTPRVGGVQVEACIVVNDAHTRAFPSIAFRFVENDGTGHPVVMVSTPDRLAKLLNRLQRVVREAEKQARKAQYEIGQKKL